MPGVEAADDAPRQEPVEVSLPKEAAEDEAVPAGGMGDTLFDATAPGLA